MFLSLSLGVGVLRALQCKRRGGRRKEMKRDEMRRDEERRDEER